MKTEKNNLFLTLLKIKSYLVSMIDEPADNNSLKMTKHYLSLRFPDKKDRIIALLEKNNILSDSEIAFDEKIVFKFRTIANTPKNTTGLTDILNKLDIGAKDFAVNETERINAATEREKRLSEILYILFKLATHWEVLKELEDKADNFSILNNEDVIRPDEEKNLGVIDDSTAKVFSTLSLLTGKYIELLANYYYSYGGKEALNDYFEEQDKTKKIIANKYLALYQKRGWDTAWLLKFSK
jgi:hypothetical protein